MTTHDIALVADNGSFRLSFDRANLCPPHDKPAFRLGDGGEPNALISRQSHGRPLNTKKQRLCPYGNTPSARPRFDSSSALCFAMENVGD